MLIIPVQAVPSQTLYVTLSTQPIKLSIYQRKSSLFMDVSVNDVAIINGVLCLNQCNIVRDAYLGFLGDFAWTDTYGSGQDPTYTGLGNQFQLLYIQPGEIFLG